VWDLNCHLPEARRMFEYVALGRQFPSLRDEMRTTGERFRKLQVEAVALAYDRRGVANPEVSPAAFAMLMSAVARSLVIEGQVGMNASHAEMVALLEKWIDRIEPAAVNKRDSGRVSEKISA